MARMMKRGLRIALVAAALSGMGLISACATITRNHGYMPAEDELAQIVVGKDNRESVAAKIGRPSAQGLLDEEGWYYVQSRFETYGPREPKEVERQVLAVTFAPNGTVQNVARYGLEHGRVVEISRRVTESNIKSIGFIRQLMGSIGQMRATELVD